MEIPHYNADPAHLDDLILDWEDFAEEVVGEMRFVSDARDKWACSTFRKMSLISALIALMKSCRFWCCKKKQSSK